VNDDRADEEQYEADRRRDADEGNAEESGQESSCAGSLQHGQQWEPRVRDVDVPEVGDYEIRLREGSDGDPGIGRDRNDADDEVDDDVLAFLVWCWGIRSPDSTTT
jgi:hypothetical protein